MKIYKKKANSSIRRRMVRYLLYVSLLPLIGLTIISIILQVRTTSSVSTSSMQTEVTLAFSDMNGRFEDAQELCRQIENNALLQRLMRSDYPNAPRKYASELEGNMELASMVLSDDAFSGVYLIGNNGIICKSDSGSLISDSFQDILTAANRDNFQILVRMISRQLQSVERTDAIFVTARKHCVNLILVSALKNIRKN